MYQKLSDPVQAYRYRYINKAGESVGQSSTFSVVQPVEAETRSSRCKKKKKAPAKLEDVDVLVESGSDTGKEEKNI